VTATTQPTRAAADALEFSVATAPASAWHRRLALVVVIATLVAFAATAPYATTLLPRVDSFLPVVLTAIFVSDLVTAVLLYAQFSATGSRPLLVLACGYLFCSLIVIGHGLTFPGAFSPTGLLGAGPQSSAWLNVLWRFGFAASIAAYAMLRGRQTNNAVEPAQRWGISWSVAIVAVVACALIFAVTAGHEVVPPVLSDGEVLPLGRYAGGVVALTALLAVVLLVVLTRGRSILDLWLIVAAFALLGQSTLVTFLVPERFSLAFYANRLVVLPISNVVLVVLLWETMRLYGKLWASNRELQRERANRLTNAAEALAAIAHEIRQPLTGINLQAYAGEKLLERTPPDVGAAKKLFREIKVAAFQANEVFDSFLKLFREGRQDVRAVDINALTLEATRLLRKELDDHNVTVSTELASGLPVVQGHTGQLREVILNLIQNSTDAMAATVDRPRLIRIATSRSGPGAVSISLQDTGPGIETENLASIFDPFVTTKAKGTGLGLAICKMIVDQHGGTLSATSPKTGGARFEITLPAGTAAPATQTTA
jgi:signal transduction histidine kinase